MRTACQIGIRNVPTGASARPSSRTLCVPSAYSSAVAVSIEASCRTLREVGCPTHECVLVMEARGPWRRLGRQPARGQRARWDARLLSASAQPCPLRPLSAPEGVALSTHQRPRGHPQHEAQTGIGGERRPRLRRCVPTATSTGFRCPAGYYGRIVRARDVWFRQKRLVS